MMKKNGFTLIELLITFVILGIATSIAIPGFARWLPDSRLKSAARELYSSMQLARLGAIKENGEWAVVFNAGGGSYQVISGGADREYGKPGDNTTEKTINLSDYKSGIGYGQGTVTIPIDASRPLGDSVTFDDSDDGDDVIVFNSRGMINEQVDSGAYAVVCLATGVILMRKWTGTAWE